MLKRVLKKAKDMGYTFMAGPECEFFLFHTDEEGNPSTVTHEKAGYFDVGPLDYAENVRRDIVLCLEEMGFEVEASHHELAPAQHEVDLQYQEGLRTADDVTTFKMTVKNIAKRHGLHATFMPKPQEGVNGSGMHINMSLMDEAGRNLFEDPNDAAGLSRLAYSFMAGILYHMKEMVLLTNPLVNSYKRLIPGYDAPNYIAWSIRSNRSALIRIPTARGSNTRIELRCPDSAANPYLALAACLAAGLDGIEKGMTPPPSVDRNHLTQTVGLEEKEAAGMRLCRRPWRMPLTEFENSSLMREVLGDHIFSKYLEAKNREWKDFRAHVTDWEVDEYLYKY